VPGLQNWSQVARDRSSGQLAAGLQSEFLDLDDWVPELLDFESVFFADEVSLLFFLSLAFFSFSAPFL